MQGMNLRRIGRTVLPCEKTGYFAVQFSPEAEPSADYHQR